MKEAPYVELSKVLSDKVYTCYSRASLFVGLTDPLQLLRRLKGFHASASPDSVWLKEFPFHLLATENFQYEEDRSLWISVGCQPFVASSRF